MAQYQQLQGRLSNQVGQRHQLRLNHHSPKQNPHHTSTHHQLRLNGVLPPGLIPQLERLRYGVLGLIGGDTATNRDMKHLKKI